jgi:hypothetical protein
MPPNRKISFAILDDGAPALVQFAVQEPFKLVETVHVQQQQSLQEKDPTAAADYWDWVAFANKNSYKDVQQDNERIVECFFSIHYIETKLIEEAAERLQVKENETVVVVAVTVDDDDSSSSDSSSYWDMPPMDEQAALVSFLLGNNQPQKKLWHDADRRPQHHAAPTGMDVNTIGTIRLTPIILPLSRVLQVRTKQRQRLLRSR